MLGWKAAGSTVTARSTTTCVSWASPVAGTAWHRLMQVEGLRSQSGYRWRPGYKANNLISSMSRRGNCHDNAVAESFSSC